MKAYRLFLLLVPILPQPVAAQESIDLFSIIVSEANSVYTQVNSILSSAASAASAAANSAAQTSSASDPSTTFDASSSTPSEVSTSRDDTSSSSFSSSTPDASTSSSRTSSTSSRSSAAFGSTNSSPSVSSTTTSRSSSRSSETSSPRTTSSRTLSTPIVGTSSVIGASAETGTSSPVSSSDSKHHSNLAIILGCVLGALALGLFILALVLCCKRRRHGSSPRHSALSVGDDEIDTWRAGAGGAGMIPSRGSSRHSRGISGTAPLMSEHPAFRNGGVHENPFVPVPPPPRRSVQNSRPSLTDGMVPGEDPIMKETAVPSHDQDTSGSRHGIAAGLAAAAAGAGLMHEHNKHKREEDGATPINDKPLPEAGARRQVSRKPVPVNHVNNADPWPYDPVSPIDAGAETAALTKASRTSGESRRSFSRDAARANAAFDQEYAPHASQDQHHHGLGAGVAGLAAGAVGGAALAHHHDNRERRRSRSSSSSNSNRCSRPPLAAVSGDDSDHSSSSRNSRESRNGRSYSDTLPIQPAHDSAPGQPNDLYGVPVAPFPRPRRNSAHGMAIPAAAAAAFAHANRPTVPSPLSSEIRPDHGYSPPQSRSRRSSSAPRYSFPYEPRGHDYGAYPPFAGYTSTSHPPHDDFPSLPYPQPPAGNNPEKAIVGDNGYPHMGIPRRKSGGEYDFSATGPLGPQTMPVDEAAASRHSTMKSLADTDDSTWRMSDGMPVGWQRASLDGSPRHSREYGGSNRDSGVGRRRLRASDFGGGGETGDDGYGQAL